MAQYYEHYRQSTLGNTLTETLDELIEAGHLTPQLAMRVLSQFDKSMAEALGNSVRNRVGFKGHLHTTIFAMMYGHLQLNNQYSDLITKQWARRRSRLLLVTAKSQAKCRLST
ncbi:general transcription factor IIA, 2, 12kDa-like protein [Syncephalis fuscata]|nr:general transcription factor IIA, 2, 12kDa-like protein [Syncephalis fuscata]